MGNPLRADAGTPTKPARRAPVIMIALAAAALANGWVAARLPSLLRDTRVSEVLELERRAAAFPRAGVRVLVTGNSHALAGLRPPLLAEALGLAREEVFSLALPASSPQEMRLLLECQLASFPRAELVVCTVDPYFLSSFQDLRLRYLTAGRPIERARYAAGQPFETQLRLLAGTWLPILDFGATLHRDLAVQPRHTLGRLVRDGPPVDPYVLRTRRQVYPWGFPPPWDAHPAHALARLGQRARAPAGLAARAQLLLADFQRLPVGVAEIERLARFLAPRGARLLLVETPYTVPLEAALRRLNPDAPHAWRAALDALPPEARPPRLPAPALPTELFYDGDHLAPAGARALARQIAASREARLAAEGARPLSPRARRPGSGPPAPPRRSE